jgi:hypothetical protein
MTLVDFPVPPPVDRVDLEVLRDPQGIRPVKTVKGLQRELRDLCGGSTNPGMQG